MRADYSENGDDWGISPDQAAAGLTDGAKTGVAGLATIRCAVLGLGEGGVLMCPGWPCGTGGGGRDADLKEPLFGMTNASGNHGRGRQELY